MGLSIVESVTVDIYFIITIVYVYYYCPSKLKGHDLFSLCLSSSFPARSLQTITELPPLEPAQAQIRSIEEEETKSN